MRKQSKLFRGELRVSVRGGERERLLNACAEAGLPLWNLVCEEGGDMCASLYENDYERFEKIAVLCMCEVSRLTLHGGSNSRRLLRARRQLAGIVAVFALLLALSSLFIWDIEVIGNNRLSKGEILRALSDCGISEGCFWPKSDVEAVRSEMLLRMDDLAWMTLNVKGSRATVLVLEREEKPEIYDESKPAELIAACDGVITDFSVKNGETLIARGQIVTKGEILVSGTMESLTGLPRQVRAEGSVTADTWHEIRISLDAGAKQKERKNGCFVILGLQMGKERINLFSNCRKELDECDKIVKEYTIGIDGLFHIPLRMVVEVYRPFARTEAAQGDSAAARERALEALREEIDGEILSHSFEEEEGALVLRAHCLENIALLREMP